MVTSGIATRSVFRLVFRLIIYYEFVIHNNNVLAIYNNN